MQVLSFSAYLHVVFFLKKSHTLRNLRLFKKSFTLGLKIKKIKFKKNDKNDKKLEKKKS